MVARICGTVGFEAETERVRFSTWSLWSPYVIGQTIIFLPCGFFLSSFFPRLISATVGCISTIFTHMAWPSANLKCMSEMCCSLQIKGAKKSPKIAIWAPSHNFVDCIFATKARIDNRKKTC